MLQLTLPGTVTSQSLKMALPLGAVAAKQPECGKHRSKQDNQTTANTRHT